MRDYPQVAHITSLFTRTLGWDMYKITREE
jgi:hypothetical protein